MLTLLNGSRYGYPILSRLLVQRSFGLTNADTMVLGCQS